MKVVNLRDMNFTGDDYSARLGVSKALKWDRNCRQPGVTVYTDLYFGDSIAKFPGKKIAWVMEPEPLHPQIYAWILKNFRLFEQVWTHSDAVIAAIPNGRWVPQCGTWISRARRGIHPKTKAVSFIASKKNFVPGHAFRNQIRDRLPKTIDSFGRGTRDLADKADGLIPYAFSIAVENSVIDTYFTEKIIDCFMTGTVPVYWGTKKIFNHFDPGGIIRFETLDQLLGLLPTLTLDKYKSMMESVKKNYELCQPFETAEDIAARYL